MEQLFSMQVARLIKHREEKPKDSRDTWEYYRESICERGCIVIGYKDDDKNKITIVRGRSSWSKVPFGLIKQTNFAEKNDLTIICEKLGAEHWIYASFHHIEIRHIFPDYTLDYVLGYDKGNIFYEENQRGKIIFFNESYYKFIPHEKYDYNGRTGLITVDSTPFVNNGQGTEYKFDALTKLFFTFKKENVYANIFEEMALYRNSTKNKFQEEDINNLIKIIL